MSNFDIIKIRKDFPILSKKMADGKPLVYFDNGASTQKPNAVIDAISHYYRAEYSNIHRGVHQLSTFATQKHEDARKTITEYLNAASSNEIILTKGTTEAINLVAQTWGRQNLSAGDEILISNLEHHANIVPWQMIAEEKGAILKVAPIDDNCDIIIEEYEKLLSDKTAIVSIGYVSNALGTVNPVKQIVELAHRNGALVLIDGAQAMPHYKVDVRDLDCDFFAFSGHKTFGPTGIGVLYGKEALLNEMPPYQGGGDMISTVTFEKSTYKKSPERFEAGTPHISGAIGLAEALNYLDSIGHSSIVEYEDKLIDYAYEKMMAIEGVVIYGHPKKRAGAISFLFEGVHSHDIASVLDMDAIAVRSGQHCTQPLMDTLGVSSTARASFAFYNTFEEVDFFIKSLEKAKTLLM